MEVMIAHPLTLPDGPLDVATLEEVVRVWGQEVQQRALAEAWQVTTARRPVPPCPACQSGAARPAGTKPRKIETTFGPVWLPRRRVRCATCGRHRQPEDPLLAAAVGSGQCTPGLRELATLCGASWPYRQAARVLGTLRGTPLAPETIRSVVAQTGAAVAEAQARAAAAVCAPPASAPRSPERAPTPVEVALDGGWVRSHDNARGMEVKVGVVHAGSERVGRTRTRLRQRRYAATLGGVEGFGPLVTAAVAHLDGYAAAERTLLGDGAEWIWRLGATILRDATPVLDRWHLHEARARALRQAVPDEDERAAWTTRIEEPLDGGDVPGALAVLADLAAAHAHPRLAEFITYLQHQAPRIPNYAARQEVGQTIGSGAIEKGVDLVVNRRLKGKRGMKWWRDRAEGVLALRVTQLNGEWDQDLPPALAL